MDQRVRELERAAEQGDPQAAARLERARERSQDYDEALEAYLQLLTELSADYYAAHYSNLEPPTFYVDEGGKAFDRIVRRSLGSESVHSFVAKRDGSSKAVGPRKRGDIMFTAGWKGPAKHPRGSIFRDPREALSPNGWGVRYLK